MCRSNGKSVLRAYYAADSITPTNWNNTIYSVGEPIPQHLLRSSRFYWNSQKNEINAQFDKGFYVLYRGHGSNKGWESMNFITEPKRSPNPTMKHPVVFSITCETGDYDNETGFFAKDLLIDIERMASAVIAASEISISGYNDVFTYSMFDAIWPGSKLTPNFVSNGLFTPTKGYRFGEYRMGKIFETGMRKMEEIAADKYKSYTRKVFHLFGDPSMQFYTEVPIDGKDLVSYLNNNCISVSCMGLNAITSVYNERRDETKAYYNVVALEIEDPDYSTICISGKNIKPYIINGSKTSSAPSKILGYTNLGGGEYLISYNISAGSTNAVLTYTPIMPISSTETFAPDQNGELRLFVNSTVSEFAVQLIVDNKVVDTIRIRTKNT